jgi:hypothetical protein
MKLKDNSKSMKRRGFQVCLQVWLVRTIKIVQLFNKGNFKIKMTIDQSFFKLLETNHFGFGMFLSVFLVITMTLMC